MSDELLITARIRLLRQSLETVQLLLKGVEESREPVNRQLSVTSDVQLDGMIKNVRGLAARFREAGERVQSDAPGVYEEIDDLADKLYGGANDIINHLKSLEKERGAPLSRRSIPLPDLSAGIKAGALVDQATAILLRLDDLRDQVEGATKLQDAQEAATAFSAAWEKLIGETLNADKVFQEYVDFLGGLALRETGFDRGLCRIADVFVRECRDDTYWPWLAWTVPAMREAREVTMARIIRLGFPEWTIWALPLAAHEFAYVALDAARLAGLAGTKDVPDIRTLLADIFATFVAGPAYACALFALRLQPPIAVPEASTGSPRQDPLLDVRRAYVTLATLKLQDDQLAGDPPTAFVRGQLDTYWTAAIAQVQPQPVLDAADRGRLDGLVGAMTTKIGGEFAFPLERWAEVEKWSQLLNDGSAADIQVVRDFTDEVRIALNAVWLARLTAETDDLGSLAADGRTLTERIIDTPASDLPPRGSQPPPDNTKGAPPPDADPNLSMKAPVARGGAI